MSEWRDGETAEAVIARQLRTSERLHLRLNGHVCCKVKCIAATPPPVLYM